MAIPSSSSKETKAVIIHRCRTASEKGADQPRPWQETPRPCVLFPLCLFFCWWIGVHCLCLMGWMDYWKEWYRIQTHFVKSVGGFKVVRVADSTRILRICLYLSVFHMFSESNIQIWYCYSCSPLYSTSSRPEDCGQALPECAQCPQGASISTFQWMGCLLLGP